MRSLNRVTLLGNATKDAETRFTQSGIAVSTFSVATNYRYKQGEEWKEKATFHNCVLWKQEETAKYLKKGKQVYVEGRIETRSYDKDGEKRYSTEIIVDNVILLGGGGEHEKAPQRNAPAQVADDSDCPF